MTDVITEKIRDVENAKLWLVVDFDDVILHTSQVIKEYDEKILAKTGLSREELLGITKEAKVENELGRKVFKFFKYFQRIKEKAKKPEIVDEIRDGISYKNFIDKPMVDLLKKIRSEIKDVKISILTFGDMEFQKFKIEETGIKDFVDEVIYTGGSKKEFVESEMEKYGLSQPFLITIDDKLDNVEEYEEMNIKNHLNIMFLGKENEASDIWEAINKQINGLKVS